MREQATKEVKANLERLLRAGVHCAIGLKETLQHERSALEAQNSDALNDIAANKHKFLNELEELESERRKMCVSGDFDSDPSAMDELVKWCDSDSLLLGYWTNFVDLARQCSDLNVSNGAIINVRRQQIAGTLSVIRGESPDNETYGRNGRDTVNTTRRILAEI